MSKLKTVFLTVAILTFAACISAQDKKGKMTEKKQNDKISACEPSQIKPSGDIKILSSGTQAKIETPFLFVARSKETYDLLRHRADNLPLASEVDFKNRAVIAAFAGEQRTGGYSVTIERSNDKYSVKLKVPPPGAITTDALTYPFEIVSVPVEEESGIALEMSEIWMNSAESYKVTSGDFEYSGGIMGKLESFKPTGTIRVLRTGDLATLMFDLKGKETQKLDAVASGAIIGEKARLASFEAGNFYEHPHPPMIAEAVFESGKVLITLESGKRDYVINDGFQGRGKIEAVKEK